MSNGKYDVKPLSELLKTYIAKNDELFTKTEIDNLPVAIKESVNIEIDKETQKLNKIFTDTAFKDLEVFNRLNYTKKFNFNFNIEDKIYFMYKLRDNKDIVKNIGYTKYSFVLEIINGETINHDSIYKLIITETATGKIGIYETTVGRFD
jgi:hypothetical protein